MAAIEHQLADLQKAPAAEFSKVIGRMRTLLNRVRGTDWPCFAGAAFQFLKDVAFRKLPPSQISLVQPFLIDIWNSRQTLDPAQQVFEPEAFLRGWIDDLQGVKPEAYFRYVECLRFEGLRESKSFVEANVRFVEEFIRKAPSGAQWDDMPIEVYIDGVLQPLADKNLGMLRELIPHAVRLVRWSAEQGRAGCVDNLVKLVRYYCARAGNDGLFTALNVDRRKMTVRQRICMDSFFDQVMPLLGGWNRLRRRAPENLHVELDLGGGRRSSCPVKDITRDGRGLHVNLGKAIQCRETPGRGQIPNRPEIACRQIEFIVNGSVEATTDRIAISVHNAGTHPVHHGHAWLLRGWRYETTHAKYSDECGIVLWIEHPDERLRQLIDDMPDLVGGHPDGHVPLPDDGQTSTPNSTPPPTPVRKRPNLDHLAGILQQVLELPWKPDGKDLETARDLLKRKLASRRANNGDPPRELADLSEQELRELIVLVDHEKSKTPNKIQLLKKRAVELSLVGDWERVSMGDGKGERWKCRNCGHRGPLAVNNNPPTACPKCTNDRPSDVRNPDGRHPA
jgi:hypothetical protein